MLLRASPEVLDQLQVLHCLPRLLEATMALHTAPAMSDDHIIAEPCAVYVLRGKGKVNAHNSLHFSGQLVVVARRATF